VGRLRKGKRTSTDRRRRHDEWVDTWGLSNIDYTKVRAWGGEIFKKNKGKEVVNLQLKSHAYFRLGKAAAVC